MKIFFALLIYTNCLFAEKVLVFTYSYNRPDFIEIQDLTFKRFLKDDYEFIVFNDASTNEMCEQIERTCQRLNLQCVRIPQEIHAMPYLYRLECEIGLYNHPTIRNCNVVQYSLNTLGFFHNGIVALFDSDLFLIKDFSIKEAMEGYDVAAVSQSKGNGIEYLWIGLSILNMETMPNHNTINFNCGQVEGVSVDAGGHTYDYLHDNPSVKFKRFNHIYVEESALGMTNCEFFHDRTFFHYRGGTNWDNQSPEYHIKKTQLFYNFINELLHLDSIDSL